MLLEVIALKPEDVRTAAENGADRVEFVAAIEEGGLTPSLAAIEEAAADAPIPVHVMIRPHSRAFAYSEEDLGMMIGAMASFGHAGAHAFVLGVLTAERTIDEEKLKRLLDAADGRPVTFHRAFDDARNSEEAFETLARYPLVRTVLTSGGRPNVLDAAEELAHLVRLSRGTSLAFMAGSGLTPETAAGFARSTGVRAVHLGSGVRFGGKATAAPDPVRIAAARAALDEVVNRN